MEIGQRECGERIASLERQLKESKSQFKRARTEFRGVLEEERARGEKNSETHNSQEKQTKELRRKIKKPEDRHNSQKGEFCFYWLANLHWLPFLQQLCFKLENLDFYSWKKLE